jgi:major membrane immunogen (membrane-anchored lipoprotein)
MKTKIIIASLLIIAASLLLPISNFAFAATIEDGEFHLSAQDFGQNTKPILSSKTFNDGVEPIHKDNSIT